MTLKEISYTSICDWLLAYVRIENNSINYVDTRAIPNLFYGADFLTLEAQRSQVLTHTKKQVFRGAIGGA